MAEEVKSDSEKKKEDWMNAKWRPMMGWVYMLTCVTDFILFPVLWSILQASLKQPVTAWQPITLQGAGLFHLSMGAIIGVAAFGRTQEKLAGANNGGINTGGSIGSGSPTVNNYAPGSANISTPTTTFSSNFGGAPAATGFGGNSGFGAAAAAPAVVTGFGGKPAPAPQQDPLL